MFVVPSVPLKREQTTEGSGRAVVFSVSEDARNTTCQSLNVDGGSVWIRNNPKLNLKKEAKGLRETIWRKG